MKKLFLSLTALAAATTLTARSYDLSVDAGRPGASIAPTMYGIFFEDINYGADGGLYAELVKNRSFEFPQALMGWNIFGNVEVRSDSPAFDRNPHYVRLGSSGHPHKHTGLDNEGFFGIGIEAAKTYRFSVWARSPQATPQTIRIELVDGNNDPFVKQELAVTGADWKKYEVILTAPKEEANARLRIFLTSSGSLDMDHISLFPTDTWMGHENGLRRDLAQALYDLRPGVFRFPGGCIVEGTDLDTRYNWKNSVGPVENRPLNENRWHYTFAHRFFPDYFQSYGLGFYEFFLLSEEIGAEPLPIVSCGLACQFQNGDPGAHVAVVDLQPYIQDALDLIEFANGPATSTWGRVRAEMGHPAPFNLKFIGVGNEQWGPEYPERLAEFTAAIRKAYPAIEIVGSSGPSSEGEQFDYLWPEMKRLKVDLVDEHYYRPAQWFLNQATRYDNYDRTGPKVFAGEYACHLPSRKNNFESALCEAAFMTGLERNADVVRMATYAPLFAHVDGWQWRPDLIWFDNLRTVRTPNYYVQQLYGHNPGTNVVSLTANGTPLTGQDGLYASAVIDTKKKEVIVKLVNMSAEPLPIRLAVAGLDKKAILQPLAEVTELVAPKETENTIERPDAVVPQHTSLHLEGNVLQTTAAAESFRMIVFRY